MSDPSKLSDADLLAALARPPAAPGGDVGKLSDADLLAALGQPAPAGPSIGMDIAKSAGSGLAKGAGGALGFIGDMANVVGNISDAGGDYLARKLGYAGMRPLRNPVAEAAGSQSINSAVDNLAGAPVTSYQPQTTAGKYAKTAGEFVPGAMLGPGGMARNAIAYGVVPGLASEAAGQAAEGTKLEPVARVAGALAGVALPGLARRAVTPLPISPERQAIVDALSAEGVPLTAGQKTGSVPLQYAESIFGDALGAGAKARGTMDAQKEAFTSAAMKRAGGEGLATADNMAANYERIGKNFRDLSARNTLVADTQLGGDINNVLQTYGRKLPSEQKSLIGDEAVEIIQRLQQNGGKMAGTDYQTIRSDLSQRAADSSDRGFARALKGLRDALDDNMARSVSPEDAAAWEAARREYGGWKTIAKASGAGTAAADGAISPQALRQAIASGKGKDAYVRGEGDFAELARNGVSMMTPLPNSGTAQRNLIAGSSGGGALAAAVSGNIPLAALLMAGPGVVGRTLYSKPAQSYLSNQLLAGKGSTPQEIVAQALLASRSASLPSPR